MDGDRGRSLRRGRLRLTHQAVNLWIAGASASEVSKRLKCPKERVMKILKPIKRGTS